MTELLLDQHAAFLATSARAALDRWTEVLKLQVELFAPGELAFLRRLRPWLEARRVLDVGCGNGDFTASLRQAFPTKAYTGIDLSREFIIKAQADHSDDGIGFSVADFFRFDAERHFDFILMRFIVQHLTDFPAVLRRASGLLSSGGSLLIVEPSVENSRNIPPTPQFETLIAKFEQARSDGGRVRKRLRDPQALLAGLPTWRIVHDVIVRIRCGGAGPLERAMSLFQLWIEMFEASGLLSYPFESVRRELREWMLAPNAQSEIALRMIVLQQTERDAAA